MPPPEAVMLTARPPRFADGSNVEPEFETHQYVEPDAKIPGSVPVVVS